MREKWAAMKSHDQVFFVWIKGSRVGYRGVRAVNGGPTLDCA